ncbi:MAG TPA: nuclear transport factor 2 family protein [Gemmatimonadaceae bacterium]|nr:nuclear transport factor 2 family protein [Gemmatimonadaceae bacterium]
MESVLVADRDPEIVSLEAQMRSAQLAGDSSSLAELISEDLLFAGPDGNLATKEQDLSTHASGVVRFREHEPQELRIRRIGADVAISSLRARLVVEVAGNAAAGVYRYTRVWCRESGQWRVAGGSVSEVKTVG